MIATVTGLVWFMMGGLLGAGALACVASAKVTDLEEALYRAKKGEDNWHDLWRKVNNHLSLVRTACKEIKVPARNNKGQMAGTTSAWELVEKAIKNV